MCPKPGRWTSHDVDSVGQEWHYNIESPEELATSIAAAQKNGRCSEWTSWPQLPPTKQLFGFVLVICYVLLRKISSRASRCLGGSSMQGCWHFETSWILLAHTGTSFFVRLYFPRSPLLSADGFCKTLVSFCEWHNRCKCAQFIWPGAMLLKTCSSSAHVSWDEVRWNQGRAQKPTPGFYSKHRVAGNCAGQDRCQDAVLLPLHHAHSGTLSSWTTCWQVHWS